MQKNASRAKGWLNGVRYVAHLWLFSVLMAMGIKDFLLMFFRAKRRPDGSNSKDWRRGWVGSCVIVLAVGAWGKTIICRLDLLSGQVLFCAWWWRCCTRLSSWKYGFNEWTVNPVKMSLLTLKTLSFLSRWRRYWDFLYRESACWENDRRVELCHNVFNNVNHRFW